MDKITNGDMMDFKEELEKFSVDDLVSIGIPFETAKNWKRTTRRSAPPEWCQKWVIEKLKDRANK